MKTKTLHIEDFHTLYEKWDALNLQSINQVITSASFIQQCINSFSTGNEFIALSEDETGPISIAILQKVGFGRWQTFQPSQAPLGLWLVRNNMPTQDLLENIADALPGFVIMIDFLQQDHAYLSFEKTKNTTFTPYIETGKLPIPENFDGYFNQLSKNTRQNYRKVHNRATKADQVLTSKKLTQEQEIKLGLEYYSEFETSGWKGKSGTAVNLNNDQGSFYLSLLSEYATQGKGEIWQFLVDDRVVATDLCISSDDTLVILKTAYDEEFKHLSPALCLKYDIIKSHSETKSLTNIEFFGKAMDWHKKLQSEIRLIQHITWFTSSIVKSIYSLMKGK